MSENIKLPEYSDFVWVKRLSEDKPVLAYYSRVQDMHNRFQNPYTVGDNEGLSVEYYADVTHWTEIKEPLFGGEWNEVVM